MILEMCFVECGSCPIASSTDHNKRTVPIFITGCIAHARNGHISTSGLKSDVTIVFLGPDFLQGHENFPAGGGGVVRGKLVSNILYIIRVVASVTLKLVRYYIIILTDYATSKAVFQFRLDNRK